MPYITYSISGEYRKDILCTSLLLRLFVKCDQKKNSVFNIDSSFSLEHMYSVCQCTYVCSFSKILSQVKNDIKQTNQKFL